MITSDIHWNNVVHGGVWEGRAFEELVATVRKNSPDVLIILGDLDHGWTDEAWKELTGLVEVRAVYGNHDNVELMRRQRNRDDDDIYTLRRGETG